MSGSFNEWHSLFLLAAAQGFFLTVLLFSVRSFDSKNKILGVLMLLYSVALIDGVWFWSEYYLDYPHLLGVSMSFPFLYGPLLYLYFKEALRSGSFSWKTDRKHFILPLVALIYLAFYYVNSAEQKLILIPNWSQSWVNALVLPVSGLVSLIFYLRLIFKGLRRFEQQSETSVLWTKNWLFRISVVFGLFVLLSVLSYFLIFFQNNQVNYDYPIALGSAFFIYFMGYLGFSKSKLLNGIKVSEVKYQSSTLTPNAGNHLYEHVKKYLDKTKVYTNNQLRLASLADQLSMTSHQLSQIINEYSETNFSDFINNYRVEEAKRRLRTEDELRMNMLAIDVGFNNKTSFNQAFKKFVGCSPTEYKKRLMN